MTRKLVSNIVSSIVLLFGISSAWAITTIQVNSTADEIDNDLGDGMCATASGVCTLRAAIMTANRVPSPGAVINLPAGVYVLTRPAALNTDENGGDLNVIAPTSDNVPINFVGAGVAQTIVDGGAIDRVFNIDVNRSVSFSDMTIRNGSAFNGFNFNGASNHNGGAIRSYANYLTLTRVVVSGNSAEQGAGIFSDETIEIDQSTITGNVASDTGGGISTSYICFVNQSTVSLNTANDGGGIANGGFMIMTNSTIADNNALNNGGGLYNVARQQAYIDIYNSTIAFNGADDDRSGDGSGGGIYAGYVGPSGDGTPLNLYNTIVAGNVVQDLPVADDCHGPAIVNLHAHNLFGSKATATAYCPTTNQISGSTALLNSTALLAPLQNNGGPTPTVALLPGSNAIDGGTGGCFDFNSQIVSTDQRGFPRPIGAACDIGAFEVSDVVFKNGFD